ncbi:MAG: alpha/beta fold hydrolase [Fuerstiella sp.]|nr:alpha/beta fold hydrolase [Fuerstiella sp.]
MSGFVQALQRSVSRTLGGRQFWSDVGFFRGWRIQENVFTDHYRLLDSENRRHMFGSLTECRTALNTVREEHQLPPMSGRAIILVHGLIRSSRSFDSLARTLELEDCTIVRFDYSSTRSSVPDAARCLSQVIESLDGIGSIDLVVHSLGGVVLRYYLRDHCDDRIRRAVMLGVPNHGAKIADRFHNNVFYRMMYGPAGQQLTSEEDGLIAGLPVPDFEFGVIAGGRGRVRGFNPLLKGDNDSTITVRSARLKGAADFTLQPVIHSFLMSDRRCVQAIVTFLKYGRFDPDRKAQPIR